MKRPRVAPVLGIGLLALAAACSRAKPAGDTVGVAECDEYLKKSADCLGKLPLGTRRGMEQSLKLQHDSYTEAASTTEGRAPLKSTCQTLLDALAANPYCK
jgi:hypothetical protein